MPTIPPINAAAAGNAISFRGQLRKRGFDRLAGMCKRNLSASWIRAVELEAMIRSTSAAPGGEASPFPGQSDRFHLLAARFLDSGKHDCARFAAGRQRDEDIAPRFAECQNLPRKDILKAVVIPDSGQKSTIPA